MRAELFLMLRFDGIAMAAALPSAIAWFMIEVLNWPMRIALVFIIALIFYMKHLRITKTRYAYSNKRVFISTWSWGNSRFNTFYISEINSITTEELFTKSGVLHFLPKRPFSFSTKGLLYSQHRHYPTIELVDNIENLAKNIRALMKNDLSIK